MYKSQKLQNRGLLKFRAGSELGLGPGSDSLGTDANQAQLPLPKIVKRSSPLSEYIAGYQTLPYLFVG